MLRLQRLRVCVPSIVACVASLYPSLPSISHFLLSVTYLPTYLLISLALSLSLSLCVSLSLARSLCLSLACCVSLSVAV